jgi:predicted glycoside hydrolase/deacetylase ChbG (UPF0249 family)
LLLAAPTLVVGQAEPSTHSARLIATGLSVSVLVMFMDMNKDRALPNMSQNRQRELDVHTSSRFREALAARSPRLLTRRQLSAIQGLQ